jgi:secreted PhoX family phosphatase
VRRSDTDGILWVNHEYVSYPFSPVAPGAPGDFEGIPGTFDSVIGFSLPSDPSDIAVQGEFMYNLGGSVLRIVRDAAGRFTVAAGDPLNRRVHGLSGLGINAERTDGYQKRYCLGHSFLSDW